MFDLVLEGGGAKGAAFVGALEVLLEGDRNQPRRIVGTSAGAITATLLAAGYTPSELLAAVTARQTVMEEGVPREQSRFLGFMDIPRPESFAGPVRDASLPLKLLRDLDLPYVPDAIEERLEDFILDRMLAKSRRYRQLFSFVERGGLYAGDDFLQWIREKLEGRPRVRGGDRLEDEPPIRGRDTLAEFQQKTDRELSVVASDTTAREMLVLNHRTAPDLPVAWAVRMSMGIPFIWQEVEWRSDWGTYKGREWAGHQIVDGGLLSNFPIRLIAKPSIAAEQEKNEEIMGHKGLGGAEILGLLIDETLEVPGEEHVEGNRQRFDLKPVERISRLLDTMMGAADTSVLQHYKDKVCAVPAKGFGTLEFDLEGERLGHFLEGGRNAMREHLKSRGFAA